jgi:transposase
LGEPGLDVREVPPTRTSDRRQRRRRPKTDREDALAVAREVLSDSLLPPAKPGLALSDAYAELAVICERRTSLMKRRQRLLNETEALLNKLPQEVAITLAPGASVRARLRALAKAEITEQTWSPATAEMIEWLRELSLELEEWEVRIRRLELRMAPLVDACGSTLIQEVGIGVVSAAELIVAVGDPTRFRSEGAFGRWCGVAPVAVSSGEGEGQPRRHRLDLLGNRRVNRILYTMSVTQARHHEPGKEFLARKRLEGKSAKEARRAHMRQLAKRIIRRMWIDQKRQRLSAVPGVDIVAA